jgi:tetratricopeptide (TPR) repeat protein
LLWEKLPFFALALLSSIITFAVQKAGGAVSSFDTVPLGARLGNALVGYVRYLSKTLWPGDLCVFYPLPDHWPLLAVVASGLLLLCLSWLVFRRANRHPYLAVGWAWFVGTLVPTIGLVQVGSQSLADRYLYIPSIGLFIIAAWGLNELAQRWVLLVQRPSSQESPASAARPPTVLPLPSGEGRGEGNLVCGERTHPERVHPLRFAPAFAAVVTLIACLACTSRQIGYWHDEETLFRHAAEVTADNYLAYDHLAKVCENAGRKEEALAYYTELRRLKPRYPEGQYNLGTLLLGMGKPAEAEEHLRTAVLLRPSWAQAYCNLGIAQFRQNKLEAAINQLRTAARLDSQNPDTYVNLGVTLLEVKRPDEAATAFSKAARLAPEVPEPQFLFALALSRERRCSEARIQAEKARQLALASGRQELVLKANELLKCGESAEGATP